MKPEKNTEVWLSPTIATPIGEICAAASSMGLIQVWFGKTLDLETQLLPLANIHRSPCSLLDDVLTQLEGYFSGNRQIFDLPVDLTRVTPFQKLVLSAVQQVPFGKTCSYSEIARRINHPKAVRAPQCA